MSADVSPQGFLTENNEFVLEHAAAELIRNNWTNVLLPAAEEEYLTRLSIPSDVQDLPQNVRALLSAYTSFNADCVSFKDETVVNIINMADNIHSYAQKVAGDGASYFVIFQSLKDMADHDSPYNVTHMSMFTLEIDALIRDSTRYRSKAQAIAKGVHRFREQVASDADDLKSTQATVRSELNREVVGDLDAKQAKIAEFRAQAKELQAQVQAQQGGGWMSTLIGLVRGPSSSATGTRLKDLAGQIGELESEVYSTRENQENGSLHPYAAEITVDMATVEESVNDVVAACGLATTILDGLVSTWGQILNDLAHLKSAVTEDPHAGASAMLKMLNFDELRQRWNTLAERVKEFLTLAREIGQEKANV